MVKKPLADQKPLIDEEYNIYYSNATSITVEAA
jgi:hypothetical protein